MLTLTPTPLGNILDISYRVVDRLQKAKLFLCEDTRVTKQLLRLLYDRGLIESMPDGDFLSFNEHNGKARLKQIAKRLEIDDTLYLSDAGMPAISDPGQLLVKYCQENQIKYDVLPGPSALTIAYASSGFSSGRFSFFGFLPHKGSKRREELLRVLNSPLDAILYESPHRLDKLLSEISSYEPDRELFLAKEISKKYQEYFRGKALELFEIISKRDKIVGEWVVILEAKAKEPNESLSKDDILNSDIPPKIKAKLLSKIDNKPTKLWYQELIEADLEKKG